ncbi:2'-5' RNA ligase family protein [Streptomyces sp. NPDC006670]|uniref:2'-5' RNA ligase family protein n=1 Tax=Streptomyces sp. NPDC006670 TaxID=3154476 RepID=UPI0033F54725
MENFFERVTRFWPAGRRDLHWHLLPTPAEAAALAAPYQDITAPELRTVPVDWMHCTLLHAIGLGRDAIDIAALLRDVRRATQTVEPFALTFDRPSVGTVGVEVSGWPGKPFTALVDIVTAAMDRTGGAFKAGPSRYPHNSLGYTSAGAENLAAVTLKTALASIGEPLAGTVLADRLHLVEQWHDGEHITWTPIAEVPLGAAA